MTQEKADRIFQSELGQQLNEIYVTSDDRAFIRKEEAEEHALENPLHDKTVVVWYHQYEAVAWDADNGQACSFEKVEKARNLFNSLKVLTLIIALFFFSSFQQYSAYSLNGLMSAYSLGYTQGVLTGNRASEYGKNAIEYINNRMKVDSTEFRNSLLRNSK